MLADACEAMFSLDDVDVTYGYGCYETLKVRDGLLYFPEFHIERLLNSAAILGITHTCDARKIREGLGLLVCSHGEGDYNIKILLIGHDDRPADWFAIPLAALHPPVGSEENGVPCLVFHGERHFPQAKSLSMLLSTVAYRKASSLGCYDALLVNRRNEITEGTRTNVFFAYVSEPRAILTPCSRDVLSGITRKTFMQALAEAGWECREAPLDLLPFALGDARSWSAVPQRNWYRSVLSSSLTARKVARPQRDQGSPSRRKRFACPSCPS